jgi:hypothetical protein
MPGHDKCVARVVDQAVALFGNIHGRIFGWQGMVRGA